MKAAKHVKKEEVCQVKSQRCAKAQKSNLTLSAATMNAIADDTLGEHVDFENFESSSPQRLSR